MKLKDYLQKVTDELKSECINKMQKGEDVEELIKFIKIIQEICVICENRNRY